MKTAGQHEHDAIAISHRLKMTVFYAKGIRNNKAFYRVFRRAGGRVILIKETTSAAALAAFMAKQEGTSVPAKKSTSAAFKPRKNPSPRKSEEDAAHLATRFHGRAPDDDEYEIIDKPKLPDTMANIGKIYAIEYIAERDGESFRFRHEFKVRSRPALAVSPDGKSVALLGGAWRFTEDGFTDS